MPSLSDFLSSNDPSAIGRTYDKPHKYQLSQSGKYPAGKFYDSTAEVSFETAQIVVFDYSMTLKKESFDYDGYKLECSSNNGEQPKAQYENPFCHKTPAVEVANMLAEAGLERAKVEGISNLVTDGQKASYCQIKGREFQGGYLKLCPCLAAGECKKSYTLLGYNLTEDHLFEATLRGESIRWARKNPAYLWQMSDTLKTKEKPYLWEMTMSVVKGKKFFVYKFSGYKQITSENQIETLELMYAKNGDNLKFWQDWKPGKKDESSKAEASEVVAETVSAIDQLPKTSAGYDALDDDDIPF